MDTEQAEKTAEKTTGRALADGYTPGDREADTGTEKTALGDPEASPDKNTTLAETARHLAQGIVHEVAIETGEANTYLQIQTVAQTAKPNDKGQLQ